MVVSIAYFSTSTHGPPLFVAGGGWLSHFMTSDLLLLSALAHRSQLPIVSVNYSLAPDNNRFPTALRECVATYRWLLDGRLGFRPKSVCLVGDSIGANLAAALCLRCVVSLCMRVFGWVVWMSEMSAVSLSLGPQIRLWLVRCVNCC